MLGNEESKGGRMLELARANIYKYANKGQQILDTNKADARQFIRARQSPVRADANLEVVNRV